MMYVELMKIFLLPIRASSWLLDSFRPPEPQNIESYFLDMMYVELMKNFLLPIRASSWLLDSFRPPEPQNIESYFPDMIYVEFMKNFFLADSSKLMAGRLISAW